jgi:hypothetical protein
VGGDDFEHRSVSAGGDRHHVGFSDESILQERAQDARVRVVAEHYQRAPADRFRQVNPLCQSHFRQAAEQIAIRSPADFRMNASIRGEVGKISPEKSRNQGERLAAGRSRVGGQRQPDGVIAPGGTILEEPLQGLWGKICPLEELEVVAFDAHRMSRA